MKKYKIFAYPNDKREDAQNSVIEAKNYIEAFKKASEIFPDFQQYGAFEING
jgi:hypothetical protein